MFPSKSVFHLVCKQQWKNAIRSDFMKTSIVFASSSAEKPSGQTDSVMEQRTDNYKSRVVEFSRDRSRDFMGQAFDAQTSDEKLADGVSVNPTESLDAYDCHGNVNLNAVMQSNVPEPFTNQGKNAPMHLNMPGGHVLQQQKSLSDDLQNAHYKHQTKRKYSSWSSEQLKGTLTARGCLLLHENLGTYTSGRLRLTGMVRPYAEDGSKGEDESVKLTSKAKFKRAIKEYGSTLVVFHVSISLVSLGSFYLAVSSGLDVSSLLSKLPLDPVLLESTLATEVSTFALAYAVHKIFAPVRIGITLSTVPFIVRYLRSVGFLRPPKNP